MHVTSINTPHDLTKDEFITWLSEKIDTTFSEYMDNIHSEPDTHSFRGAYLELLELHDELNHVQEVEIVPYLMDWMAERETLLNVSLERNNLPHERAYCIAGRLQMHSILKGLSRS